MPTRSELADLVAVPAIPDFAPCAANQAITATYVAVSKPSELESLWSLLREAFARDWSAYFTAAGGDRGLRIGPRPRGRRAILVAARIHLTAQGMKLSSHRRFGGFNRQAILGPDHAPTTELLTFLAYLPPVPKSRPLFAPSYDHDHVLAATRGLLPRDHPPR